MTRRGFPLIELMAVLVIFGLLAAVALPSFQLQSHRVLEDESRRLAGSLEFARQRAVMTGIPHRVWLDLDRSEYRIEAYGELEAPDAADAADAAPAPAPVAGALSEEELANLSLSPPPEPERAFHPLLGTLGDSAELDQRARIAGFETSDGSVASGQAYIAFDRNGTSDYAAVDLDNDRGERIRLHVEPLADSVWIEHVEQ